MRHKTKVFFTDQRYRFSEDEYDEHEFLLVRLVHNSKKGDIVTRTLGNFDENYRFRMLLKDIFGAKPNSKNLKEFFQIEVIWKLWSGDGGFLNSETYNRILNDEFSKD